MELLRGNVELEELNKKLNDPEELRKYKEKYDSYALSWVPKILGTLLVWCGNIVYGKKPTYLKFRAVEVIARVPYQSWSSAAYTLLTLFYTHEQKAMQLSRASKFARVSQDNETMHVVVISQLAQNEEKAGVIRHTCIPMVFAFFYFWASYWLYIINPRYSYELNFMFESHAFEQYSRFLVERKEFLLQKPIHSAFLDWYGRNPKNQYEFFTSVRNDEMIHRNSSIDEIKK